MAANILHSSRSSQWFTPRELLDRERDALGGGFDFDPASCAPAQLLVEARRWHDGGEHGDALRLRWRCARMHLNPPYSRHDGGPAGRWVERALFAFLGTREPGASWVASDPGDVVSACLVLNATPERRWFRWLWPVASIAFLHERVAYVETAQQALARWVESERAKKRRASAAARSARLDQLMTAGARAGLPEGLTPGPQPTHPTIVAYLGSDPHRFAKAFRSAATIIPAGAALSEAA